MRIRNVLGKTYMRLFTTNRDLSYHRHLSATSHNAARHSRNFEQTFQTQTKKGKSTFQIASSRQGHESNLIITIKKMGKSRQASLGGICLGFGKKTIYIESIQGGHKKKSSLNEFRRLLKGKPWQNYLVEEVEKHAKSLGFKKIKIRAPETLYYYHHPAYITDIFNLIETEKRRLTTLGLKKDEVEKKTQQYEKKLENKIFLMKERRRTLREHQKRMLEMYVKTAEAMGYTRVGMTYVKTL